MNREEMLKALAKELANFIIHPNLIGELSNILKNSGVEAKFLALLAARLKYLSEHGPLSIQYREGFESLTNKADNLYSMRLIGKTFNIRILYSFLSNGTPVLLLAFYEKAGKRVSSYEAHIPAAKTRLQSMMEVHDRG